MDKIQSQQLLDLIVAAVRNHLAKYSAFSNTSLAYYGCEIDIPSFTITTYSRQEQKLQVGIKETIGDVVGDIDGELEPSTIKIGPLVKTGGNKPTTVGKYGKPVAITGTAEASEVRG